MANRLVQRGGGRENWVLCELELGARAYATRAAGLGIFAHHADTPHGIRLAIQHAMKEGLTKFVVCTSTLAQGVNFPLKYRIVTSTSQGRDQILVRDFHNLIGRAGRAGMHTEGSVIFSSPSILASSRQGPHCNGEQSLQWLADGGRLARSVRTIDPLQCGLCKRD